jgi:quinol monooxygenase YgiN
MATIMTILEAHVAPGREQDLEAAYRDAAGGPLPPGLLRSMLRRDSADPTRWSIETVWRSREALERMRGTGTPRGVQVFRAAGVEPTLTIHEVIAELSAT